MFRVQSIYQRGQIDRAAQRAIRGGKASTSYLYRIESYHIVQALRQGHDVVTSHTDFVFFFFCIRPLLAKREINTPKSKFIIVFYCVVFLDLACFSPYTCSKSSFIHTMHIRNSHTSPNQHPATPQTHAHTNVIKTPHLTNHSPPPPLPPSNPFYPPTLSSSHLLLHLPVLRPRPPLLPTLTRTPRSTNPPPPFQPLEPRYLNKVA